MEEDVYLLKLELENVRCFSEKAMLDLSDGKGNWKKWTVILGNNGTGKTTLLQLIANFRTYTLSFEFSDEMLFHPEYSRQIHFKILPSIFLNKSITSSASSILKGSLQMTTTLSKSIDLPDMYVTQTNLGSNVNVGTSDYSTLKMYGYGANRFMSKNSIAEFKLENSATLFDDDAKLINAEEWLLNLDYAASRESAIKIYAIKKREQVKELLLEILPDVEAIRFTEPTKEKLIPVIEFQTPYGWVTIHQLSLGYKTMVAWMVDLAARMFERYPDSDNPLAEPAIVLVDEIDLHMHPKWQRKIFDYLSEKFPKTQFIVTAHSPLIVQSAPKDANIVLLRREGDHVVIDNDIKSVHNWRIDQILNSDLFGNISQRTPDIEEWMNEREELLKKEKLTKEEKKRLKELEEQIDQIPTADNQRDIEAMEIIRKAANYLKTQTA